MSTIKELENKILTAREDYYNGIAQVSDAVFDAWIDELIKLDPTNPAIIMVGALAPVSEWKKEKHLVPLGSLDKVNSPEEITDWIIDDAKNKDIFVMSKIDGLSLGIQYKNGKAVKAVSRGGGLEGEDIFSNAVKMKGFKKKISDNFTGTIRAEIVLKNEDHKKHLSTYSNPRNAASGVARRFDGSQSEHLSIIAYQVIGDKFFPTEISQIKWLEDNGFEVPKYKLCQSHKDVVSLWQDYQKSIRTSIEYEIDGLVCAVNDLEFQADLGELNMRPKGKMAFKFPNETAKSKIKNIEFQVGSTGRITPVAILEKVKILGVDIERASVYNMAYLQKLELDVGAEVLVCRANDVIPRIEDTLVKTGTVASHPKKCPVCSGKVEMQGEYLVCINSNSCPAQQVGKLENWISNLNVLELGETLIHKLFESGLVTDIADFYTLTTKDLSNLERMGDKSAENVYNSIHSIKELPLEVFLGSLSMPNVGISTIKMVMDAGHNTLEKIQKLSENDLQKIKGLGPQKAKSLYDGLITNKFLINKLFSSGIKIKEISVGSLTGKSFCFTGAANLPRKILEQKVTENGGAVKSSVNKDLSYLVTNDTDLTSSKALNAKKFNVKIISEETFLNMLN